ncbi:Xaa-Pro peptidase family protein [Brucella pseudintermedia]|uniref:Xaa-Pro peptidase family protein n=1 Tax=Brucella pseudintermedia TaxID=370111 RepID=UPI00320A9CBD
MTYMDRHRVQELLAAEGLDALVLFQPENFRYATGVAAGVATMWGRAGSAIALVPADASAQLGAIVSDQALAAAGATTDDIDFRSHRIWIDAVTVHGARTIEDINAAYRASGNIGPRPETFDQPAAFQLLADMIAERSLARASIGIDLEFVPAADFERLKAAVPSVRWRDASGIVKQLRLIKSAREIEFLRNAAHYAESGLQEMAAKARSGATAAELSDAWLAGATSAAEAKGKCLSGHWAYISVGPNLQNPAARLAEGGLIKPDVGTLVNGYSSDGARTYVHGEPAPLARQIYDALFETFHAGIALLKPGNTFGQVHETMLSTMRRHGFSEYYRGHFGHSVGSALGIEEWPFISRGNNMVFEPNMVLAVEAPFYANGIGALMIEEQFLITADGAETMNALSRELVSIG